MYKGFAVNRALSGLEQELNLLKIYSYKKGLDMLYVHKPEDIPKDYIPFGEILWMDKVFNYMNINIIIDYYPQFLNEYLHRKIWYTDTWPYETRCFIKSADKYKKITGFIKEENTWNGHKKSCKRYACSEVINNIKHEWRYYIDNGNILASYQYDDFDMELPAPKLDINFPDKWCGCVDFGLTDDNNLILIESQHPFSCGWYGPVSESDLYIQWVIHGWEFIINESK